MSIRAIAAVLLAGCAASAVGGPDPVQEAEALAACAAYHFNAANAKSIGEYDAHYSAGERAYNTAVRGLGRSEADRLMAEAATEMTATTGGDWRNFARVDARYAERCDVLNRRHMD